MEGLQIETDGKLSRADLLLKGALAAGAVAGLGAVGPFVHEALGAEEKSDAEILNFLLSFEYLQASIHNRAKLEINDYGEKMHLDAEQKDLVEWLLAEDGEHVAALKQKIEELDGEPDEKGSYAFAFRDFSTYLVLSGQIETYSVGAYNGAIPSIEFAEARELASSIVQIDGRHAAALQIANKEAPALSAFDQGLTEDTAINTVVRFTGIYPDFE